MLLACLLVAGLFAASIFTHYEALRLISLLIDSMIPRPRRCILIVVAGAMAAHLAEITIWAVGYWAAETQLGLGQISPSRTLPVAEFFYFSAETFTSLGLGDHAPIGPMRLMVGMETLMGLLLIAWSSSFTFLSMTKFWEVHKRKRTARAG